MPLTLIYKIEFSLSFLHHHFQFHQFREKPASVLRKPTRYMTNAESELHHPFLSILSALEGICWDAFHLNSCFGFTVIWIYHYRLSSGISPLPSLPSRQHEPVQYIWRCLLGYVMSIRATTVLNDLHRVRCGNGVSTRDELRFHYWLLTPLFMNPASSEFLSFKAISSFWGTETRGN